MKRIIIILIPLLWICTQCCTKDEQNTRISNSIYVPNNKTVEIIKKYIHKSDSAAHVFELVIEQKDYQVEYYLTTLRYYSHIVMNLPDHYFVLDDKYIILINSGLNTLSEADTSFFKHLKLLIKGNLIYDLKHNQIEIDSNYQGQIYDDIVWKVYEKNNCIKIDTVAMEPRLNKPNEAIRFTPVKPRL